MNPFPANIPNDLMSKISSTPNASGQETDVRRVPGLTDQTLDKASAKKLALSVPHVKDEINPNPVLAQILNPPDLTPEQFEYISNKVAGQVSTNFRAAATPTPAPVHPRSSFQIAEANQAADQYPTGEWTQKVMAWAATHDWLKLVRAAESAAGSPPLHQHPTRTIDAARAQTNDLMGNADWVAMWVEWCKRFSKTWGVSRMAFYIVRLTYHAAIVNSVMADSVAQRTAPTAATEEATLPGELFADDPAGDINSEGLPAPKVDR